MIRDEYTLAEVTDELGLRCPLCLAPAYPKQIETGPKGTQFRVECVTGHRFTVRDDSREATASADRIDLGPEVPCLCLPNECTQPAGGEQ